MSNLSIEIGERRRNKNSNKNIKSRNKRFEFKAEELAILRQRAGKEWILNLQN